MMARTDEDDACTCFWFDETYFLELVHVVICDVMCDEVMKR